MPENITVAEASQLCAAKRTDCVLVVDDDEGLSGIFTAKDLAYRVRNVLSLSSSIQVDFSKGYRGGLGSSFDTRAPDHDQESYGHPVDDQCHGSSAADGGEAL